MHNFIIETHNLIIRKFTPEDWSDLAEILTDEEVVYYEPYEVFTVDKCKDEAVNFANSDSFFAVVLKDNNKVIGKLYFNDQKEYDTYELGYTFNKSYQGKGYAKESSLALIKYAFSKMNVRRIIAEADVTNEKSWHLLEKLGLRREGKFVDSCYKFTDENGKPVWKSIYSYAILDTEFVI